MTGKNQKFFNDFQKSLADVDGDSILFARSEPMPSHTRTYIDPIRFRASVWHLIDRIGKSGGGA